MTARKRPGPQDRLDAIRCALRGVANSADPLSVAPALAALHPKNDTFPDEVLLGLAADALDEAGATRSRPVLHEDIRERYLPEIELSGRADHHRSPTPFRPRP